MESKLSELKQKIDKEKKKQYIRQLNEPPHLTLGEEV